MAMHPTPWLVRAKRLHHSHVTKRWKREAVVGGEREARAPHDHAADPNQRMGPVRGAVRRGPKSAYGAR